MFDDRLNPLRAAVHVLLQILTDADVKANPPAKAFMDSYLQQKEWFAEQPGSSGPTKELLAAVKNKPPG